MSWCDTSLCGVLRDEVEIVLSVVGRVFNVPINQSSRWRIYRFARFVFGKKALVYPFVNDDYSDVWLASLPVVHCINGLVELSYLFLKHRSSLRVSNTISEKNNVLREFPIMVCIGIKTVSKRL